MFISRICIDIHFKRRQIQIEEVKVLENNARYGEANEEQRRSYRCQVVM